MQARSSHRWLSLVLLCSATFMTILDGSIINVALPTIQRELSFTVGNLQWIITGYALTYGGFLLFAGRASDLFGRRRLFLAGVTLFSLASLLCGLSHRSRCSLLHGWCKGLEVRFSLLPH